MVGGEDGGLKVRVWEDLTIAALTDVSIVANFGRRVDGIWRSSWCRDKF